MRGILLSVKEFLHISAKAEVDQVVFMTDQRNQATFRVACLADKYLGRLESFRSYVISDN